MSIPVQSLNPTTLGSETAIVEGSLEDRKITHETTESPEIKALREQLSDREAFLHILDKERDARLNDQAFYTIYGSIVGFSVSVIGTSVSLVYSGPVSSICSLFLGAASLYFGRKHLRENAAEIRGAEINRYLKENPKVQLRSEALKHLQEDRRKNPRKYYFGEDSNWSSSFVHLNSLGSIWTRV